MRSNDRMPPTTGWHWAAHSLEFTPPRALVRGTLLGAPYPIPADTQEKARSAKAQEPETEESKNAPRRPTLAQGFEPGDQMMAPEQPIAPKRQSARGAPASRFAYSSGLDDAPPSGAQHTLRRPKSKDEDAFRGDHWRGLRRPKRKGDTKSAHKHSGTPSAPSSWPLDRNDWSEWKK